MPLLHSWIRFSLRSFSFHDFKQLSNENSRPVRKPSYQVVEKMFLQFIEKLLCFPVRWFAQMEAYGSYAFSKDRFSRAYPMYEFGCPSAECWSCVSRHSSCLQQRTSRLMRIVRPASQYNEFVFGYHFELNGSSIGRPKRAHDSLVYNSSIATQRLLQSLFIFNNDHHFDKSLNLLRGFWNCSC